MKVIMMAINTRTITTTTIALTVEFIVEYGSCQTNLFMFDSLIYKCIGCFNWLCLALSVGFYLVPRETKFTEVLLCVYVKLISTTPTTT